MFISNYKYLPNDEADAFEIVLLIARFISHELPSELTQAQLIYPVVQAKTYGLVPVVKIKIRNMSDLQQISRQVAHILIATLRSILKAWLSITSR